MAITSTDPRVLALAKAHIDQEYPRHIPWDSIIGWARRQLLIDARKWLAAADAAGLLATPAPEPADG